MSETTLKNGEHRMECRPGKQGRGCPWAQWKEVLLCRVGEPSNRQLGHTSLGLKGEGLGLPDPEKVASMTSWSGKWLEMGWEVQEGWTMPPCWTGGHAATERLESQTPDSGPPASTPGSASWVTQAASL